MSLNDFVAITSDVVGDPVPVLPAVLILVDGFSKANLPPLCLLLFSYILFCLSFEFGIIRMLLSGLSEDEDNNLLSILFCTISPRDLLATNGIHRTSGNTLMMA